MQDDDNDSLHESKSKRKRQMAALQDLGKALVELPEAQLAKIPLDPSLADAVKAAKSLTTHGAIRRQLQYIGKIMRHVDCTVIQEALDKIQHKHNKSTAEFHQLERLRDRLIDKGDIELEGLINQYPDIDIQYLRQLIRNAQKNKPGAGTELFRYLRDLNS